MTAVEHDRTYYTSYPELEDFLDERSMRYQVIDGSIVVNAAATWEPPRVPRKHLRGASRRCAG